VLVISVRTTDDRDVRLWFVIIGDPDGLLRPPCPPGWYEVKQILNEPNRGVTVLRALWHLGHHVAVDEFNPLGINECARGVIPKCGQAAVR
jgi:hypothetical protein